MSFGKARLLLGSEARSQGYLYSPLKGSFIRSYKESYIPKMVVFRAILSLLLGAIWSLSSQPHSCHCLITTTAVWPFPFATRLLVKLPVASRIADNFDMIMDLFYCGNTECVSRL